jgi:hypothetical protein
MQIGSQRVHVRDLLATAGWSTIPAIRPNHWGPLTNVRCAEGVYAPAFRLATRNQGTYARDFMKGILGKACTERFPDLKFRRIA